MLPSIRIMEKERFVQAVVQVGTKTAQIGSRIASTARIGVKNAQIAGRAAANAARGTAPLRAASSAAEVGLLGVGVAGMAGAFDPTYENLDETQYIEDMPNAATSAATQGSPIAIISSSSMSCAVCVLLVFTLLMALAL